MSKNTRSLTAVNMTLSVFLVSFLGLTSASASPSDNQAILNAARQLGLAQHASTPDKQARAIQRNTQPVKHLAQPIKRLRPWQLKRQQVLRRDAAIKRARLAKIKYIRAQQFNLRTQQAQQQRNINRRANRVISRHNQGNVWGRVYNGFRIQNNNYRPLVKHYINKFSRNPIRIERLSSRASDYLFMVVNELNRRHMPTELALLPFVESAYRNTAYSHAGAAGMWQFIPSTGRIYGLKQTGSYDARMDSFAATRAALDYLQKLNRQFRGDWLLSLAAYNAGENRIQRAIMENRRRGKRTDYWSLRLPRETQHYVPRLLAFKEILRRPGAYRVRLRAVPNVAALTQIRVNKAVDLRKAAAHAGLPANTLASLNPSYLHGITTPRFSNSIIVPRQHAGRLSHVIQRLPAATDVHYKRTFKYAKYSGKRRYKRRGKRIRYITHKVRSGDNLYRIALKHGTTVKKIKRLNKMHSNKIWPGKRLRISSNSKHSKRRRS